MVAIVSTGELVEAANIGYFSGNPTGYLPTLEQRIICLIINLMLSNDEITKRLLDMGIQRIRLRLNEVWSNTHKLREILGDNFRFYVNEFEMNLIEKHLKDKFNQDDISGYTFTFRGFPIKLYTPELE